MLKHKCLGLDEIRRADSANERCTSYVVTLVHGTWAGKRKWTSEDSLLRSTLQKRLGPVEFRTVVWSGGNWAHDRLAAAARIQAHLSDALRERPDARHFVIAHSHGGNAVMYALRDDELQRRLAGTVFLATPFLHVAPPQFNEGSAADAMKGALILFAVLVALVLASILVSAAVPFSDWFNRFSSSLIGSVISLLLSFGLLFAFPRVVAAPFVLAVLASERLTQRFTRLRRELTLPQYPVLPVLILRTTGDEASGVLAMSQFLSWLVGRITSVLASLANKIRLSGDEGGRLWSFLLIAVWALTFAWVRKSEPIVREDFAYPIWTLFVSLMIGAMSLALFVWVVRITLLAGVALLLFVRAMSLVPFGIDVALASVVLQITAEATPPGSWTLTHVPGRPAGPSGFVARFAHSHIYNDEDTLEAIANFLRDKGASAAR